MLSSDNKDAASEPMKIIRYSEVPIVCDSATGGGESMPHASKIITSITYCQNSLCSWQPSYYISSTSSHIVCSDSTVVLNCSNFFQVEVLIMPIINNHDYSRHQISMWSIVYIYHVTNSLIAEVTVLHGLHLVCA